MNKIKQTDAKKVPTGKMVIVLTITAWSQLTKTSKSSPFLALNPPTAVLARDASRVFATSPNSVQFQLVASYAARQLATVVRNASEVNVLHLLSNSSSE